jgi:hypothetical protein
MRFITFIAGAAIAVGVAGCKKETSTGQPAATPGQKVGQGVDAATQKAKDVKDDVVSGLAPSGSSNVTGMRAALEGVIQNVLDKNDLKSAAAHFTGVDEQRIKASSLNLEPLNAEITKFKDAWKAKYNDNFSVMDADKVFAADYAALTADENKKGTVTIKAADGVAELKIPMVSEGGKWRVDVPDEVDGPTLLKNVTTAVQDANGIAPQWPTDKLTAYRIVARRVLQAVMNAPAK